MPQPSSLVFTPQDAVFMTRAQALSEAAVGLTEPNPRVGCVITSEDGQLLGEGHTQPAGQAHAEVMALRDAAARGHDVRGATAYVTLEPCAHHGRTPPCVEAILRAGVRRVVAAVVDPNPLVAGQGLARLREAGLLVESGVLEEEATLLNEAYFKYIRTKRPFVAIKTGMSLDGKIATASGESQWITSEASRAHVQTLRATYDAIMVGVNTVVQDNPRLTCRVPGARQPLKIVVDSMARTPATATIFDKGTAPGGRPNVLVCVSSKAPEDRVRALQAAGAEIMVTPDAGFASDTHVDLGRLMPLLGKRGLTSIILEGGGTLNAAALESGIVDKVYVYVAPKIIGGVGAPTMVEGAGVTLLDEAVPLYRLKASAMGPDVLLTAYARPD